MGAEIGGQARAALGHSAVRVPDLVDVRGQSGPKKTVVAKRTYEKVDRL